MVGIISSLLAYLLLFGIPLLIIGITAYADAIEVGSILSFINFMMLLNYFIYINVIPIWILIMTIIIMSGLFVKLYLSLLGGSSNE